MRWLGIVMGVLILLAGAILLVSPGAVLSWGRSMITPRGLTGIAAGRIILGLIFVLTAPASRARWVLRALGALVIIAGLITPWFGVERSNAVLDWMTRAEPVSTLCAAAVAMVIGGLLVFAYWPRAQAAAK
ncbi:MAG TPA: hypothetical protein VL123_01790 [Candidatus Udaeobacter sp.]|jgi:hypothetical protein|nr:hypothetical protein [Candidatus Udaeobacter sp.]